MTMLIEAHEYIYIYTLCSQVSQSPNRQRGVDQSPNRTARRVDQSPSRSSRRIDQSPSRRARCVDQSPSRSRSSDQSPSRSARSVDQSPTRARRIDSPARLAEVLDQSPCRASNRDRRSSRGSDGRSSNTDSQSSSSQATDSQSSLSQATDGQSSVSQATDGQSSVSQTIESESLSRESSGSKDSDSTKIATKRTSVSPDVNSVKNHIPQPLVDSYADAEVENSTSSSRESETGKTPSKKSSTPVVPPKPVGYKPISATVIDIKTEHNPENGLDYVNSAIKPERDFNGLASIQRYFMDQISAPESESFSCRNADINSPNHVGAEIISAINDLEDNCMTEYKGIDNMAMSHTHMGVTSLVAPSIHPDEFTGDDLDAIVNGE